MTNHLTQNSCCYKISKQIVQLKLNKNLIIFQRWHKSYKIVNIYSYKWLFVTAYFVSNKVLHICQPIRLEFACLRMLLPLLCPKCMQIISEWSVSSSEAGTIGTRIGQRSKEKEDSVKLIWRSEFFFLNCVWGVWRHILSLFSPGKHNSHHSKAGSRCSLQETLM